MQNNAHGQVEVEVGGGAPRLRRVLTLWDLIFYGIVLIMPIAPIPLFGIAQKLSYVHFVTTIMVAMVAMMFTAVSYGRMAALYPAAGSAYTYVGRGLHPHLGFLAGWAMFLAFMGVNLAAFRQFTFLHPPGRSRRWFMDTVMPLLGFAFCLWIWLGLKTPAKVIGGIWFLIGLTYCAIRTRGFRVRPIVLDFSEG